MSDFSTRPNPLPASPPVKEASQPLVYRPLSLLAVAGCGLAILYTAFILINGLVALWRGTPWLQDKVWVLIPIAAVALSILGLVRVQRSEGTLAGEKVARWGLLLSVLVGVGYWAYYGATYVAIAREADQFSRDFLEKLSRGEDTEGFRMTLNPDTRPADGPGLRGQLEQRFNSLNDQGRPGMLSNFTQDEKVRMLAMGDPNNMIVEPMGVSKLEYAGGGYEVSLQYRVKKPYIELIFSIPVVGREGKHAEGRQWAVLWDQVGMAPGDVNMNARGRALFESTLHAHKHLEQSWLPSIHQGKKEELYLETLPPKERFIAAWRVGMFGGSMACGCPALTRLALVPGYDLLLDRTLVRAEKDFWAPDELREEVQRLFQDKQGNVPAEIRALTVRELFVRLVHDEFRRPSPQLAGGLQSPSSAKLPRLRIQDGRVKVDVDIAMMLPLGTPRYVVEARILMDYDEAELGKETVRSWQVRHVELVSARSIPAQAMMRPDLMQRGGPGGPGSP